MGGTQEIIGFYCLLHAIMREIGGLVDWRIAPLRSLCNALYFWGVPIAIGMVNLLRFDVEATPNTSGLRPEVCATHCTSGVSR